MPLYKMSNIDDSNSSKKQILKKQNKAIKGAAGHLESETDRSEIGLTDNEKRRKKKIVDMTFEEQVEAAKETTLNILSMVAKSRKQLFDRLVEKGYSEEAAEGALVRLEEVNIVNDTEFASQWAHSRHYNSGLAPYAIKRELTLKGIAEDIIESTLSQFEDSKLQETALELARKKAKSVTGDKSNKVRKVASAIARKGYNSSIAFSVAKQAIMEITNEDTTDLIEEN
jgi:regulatory protein